MNFVIEEKRLAELKESARKLPRAPKRRRTPFTGCGNCRYSCDSWCTAMCHSAGTKSH